jgi:hypothetical protein
MDSLHCVFIKFFGDLLAEPRGRRLLDFERIVGRRLG